MTSTEAAEFIGISLAQVLWLCRNGKLKSQKRKYPNQCGYTYRINKTDARKYRDSPRKTGPKKKS